MVKKTITYTDYNDVERTEDFYFDLSEAEVIEMELGIGGGLVDMVGRIVNAKEQPDIIKTFKEIVLKAYGEKSPDGKYFNKSPEISHAFSCTKAYSKIFMELATNEAKASEFFNGIIPKKIDLGQVTQTQN